MRRVVAALLFPEGLILLGAAAAVRWPAVLAPLQPVLPWLPVLVLVAGIALAVRFHRTGVLFALIVLAAAGAALTWAAGIRAGGGSAGVLEPAIAILLPLDLLALAILPERGLASAATARRLTALIAQAALLLVLARPEQATLWPILSHRTFSGALLPATAPLGDAALACHLGAIAALAVVALRSGTPLARGFLWAVAAALLALAVGPEPIPAGLTASELLLTVAGLSLAVAVIETAHALAFRDALTGLPGRRALDDTLRRHDGPFTIAMVDVDHFKSVNDTWGHEVGDQVLRMVATHLEEVEAGGRAFRYGGEEFAILFSGREAADALDALEAVREHVAASRFTVRGADRPRRKPRRPRRRDNPDRLSVTVSMGVARRQPGEATAEAVIARADAALYRAKRAGRNRIVTGRADRRD